MSRRPILLIGAGGHARACVDVIEQEGRFDVVGYIGTPDEVGEVVLGYKVVGADDDIARLAHEAGAALVTIGQIKTADHRVRLFRALEAVDCELPAIVSPRAHVSRHAVVGAGTIVMHGAVINAAARVGKNCIINTLALVEHDAVVGDHCHIATGAMLNSSVTVDEGSFVGSNSTVRQGIAVGAWCVIGMGQRVLADVAPRTQVPTRPEKATQ